MELTKEQISAVMSAISKKSRGCHRRFSEVQKAAMRVNLARARTFRKAAKKGEQELRNEKAGFDSGTRTSGVGTQRTFQ